MSNSANSDEIDEVMSSVRKLVTKGDGQAVRDDASNDSPSDRLILTPALRVTEADDGKEDAPAEADNVLVLDAGKRTELEGLEATIAELEAAVAPQPDDWEPDEGETFDEAAWAVSASAGSADQTDEADAETDIEDQPEVAAKPDDPAEPEEEFEAGLSAFLDPSTTIDQDILRDMIIQIVREELSGETGERITRNVRKLVRREINQLLATKDLR